MKMLNPLKALIGLLCLSLPTVILSQFGPSYSNFDTRKGNIVLKAGMEYRVTPFYSMDNFIQENQFGRFTNIDNLNTGEAFSYGLEVFLSKRLSLNIQHSLRQSLVVLPIGEVDSNFGVALAEKQLLTGFHGFFDYHLQIFLESEIFFRFGISTYNGGSNFIVRTTVFGDNGEILRQPESQGNFSNEGFNLGTGYAKERFKLLLGIYTSRGNVTFNRSTPVYTPYIKLSYNIVEL